MAPPRPSATIDDPAPAPAPVTQPKAPRRRRTRMQRVIIAVGILAVFAIVAAIVAVGYGYYRFNQINKTSVSLTKVGANKPQNYLVVGSDTRDGLDKSDPDYKAFVDGKDGTGPKHSDTIMIMRVDSTNDTINMLSLPRDLWVPIADTGESQRINTAYSADDGPQRLIDTIQQDFGIPINHYVEINFKGFKGVVDAIGGVPMYFDTPMRDDNSGLDITQAGCTTLDGEQALGFARARHLEYKDEKGKWKSDPTGDLGRITRQQVFMRKVIDRAEGKATSLDIRGTNDLINAAVKNLTVDNSFGLDTMLALSKEFKAFSGDQMVTHALPATPWTTNGGADVLKLDTAAAAPIFALFKGADAAPQVNPADVTLSVRNSSGVNGAAAKAQGQLQTLGFTVSATDTGATTTTATQVLYGSGADAQADLVAKHVKGGIQAQADSSLAAGEVRLVLGKDFTGVVDDAGKTVVSTPKGTASTTTTVDPTTISKPIGQTPGEPPPGVSCG
ncbi:MAG: LCP family protein [Acidimicrobiales bacterium]